LSSLACRAKLPSPPAGPDWIHEIKHDGLACHHVQTCTDREQPTRKIVRRKQIARTSRAHSKKWHAAGCYLPSKWSGWTVRKRGQRGRRFPDPRNLSCLSRQGCDCDKKAHEESAHAASHQNIVQRLTHGRPSVDEARCYRGQRVASLQ
jgi:hypothetical protein